MAIDADGAPIGYHPLDKKSPDNQGKAFDWLTSVNIEKDLHGIQGKNGATGPNPGYYVSATSLQDGRFKTTDTHRYVDASEIPFIVLPVSGFPVPAGTTLSLGCVAFVVDTTTGGSSGAIYADEGPAVGEGSIALARRLGLDPLQKRRFPKVTGFDDPEDYDRFLCILFPKQIVPPPWSAAAIQQVAEAEFLQWGGDALLKNLFPKMPQRRPPDTSPLPSLPNPGEG